MNIPIGYTTPTEALEASEAHLYEYGAFMALNGTWYGFGGEGQDGHWVIAGGGKLFYDLHDVFFGKRLAHA